MKSDSALAPPISPIDILSGIGGLSRIELCPIIALLESVDGLFLMKGALGQMIDKVGIRLNASDQKITKFSDALRRSELPDAVLRYRLWVGIAGALAIPVIPPFSSRSASQAASALAVRASQRLTPSIRERRRAAPKTSHQGRMVELIGSKAADTWNAAKRLVKGDNTLSFRDIVGEELLNLLADHNFISEAAAQADPETAAALRRGHDAALKTIAAAGVGLPSPP